MRKVWLLKHPVSAKQKAEAREKGVRIIDARFADQFTADELYTDSEVKQKRKRNKKD